MADFIEIQGDEELMKFFSDMKDSFAPAIIRAIARRGAKPILDSARSSMPIEGNLGNAIKSRITKIIVIKNDKRNKSAVDVTLSNQYLSIEGNNVSIGKVIRHLAGNGPQHGRYKKNKAFTGQVRNRFPDFIHSAFLARKTEAVKIIQDEVMSVMEKKLSRLK